MADRLVESTLPAHHVASCAACGVQHDRGGYRDSYCFAGPKLFSGRDFHVCSSCGQTAMTRDGALLIEAAIRERQSIWRFVESLVQVHPGSGPTIELPPPSEREPSDTIPCPSMDEMEQAWQEGYPHAALQLTMHDGRLARLPRYTAEDLHDAFCDGYFARAGAKQEKGNNDERE